MEQGKLEEVESIITSLVGELCNEAYINSTTNLINDLYLNSLDLVYLAASIEKLFGIVIEDWEISNSEFFSSINSISRFVIEKTEK